MNEELITKSILKWLIDNQWQILSYDFPQSGTGHVFQCNTSSSKNKESIIPDIVAIKCNTCVFFENKDRFCKKDFLKQQMLITNNQYSEAIEKFLIGYNIENIYYGIGLPTAKYSSKQLKYNASVDFVIGVNKDKTINSIYTYNNDIFL